MDIASLPIQPPGSLPITATDAQKAAWLDQWRIVAMFAQAKATERLAESNEAGQLTRDRQAAAAERHAQAQADTASALDRAAVAQVNAARIIAAQDRPTPVQMAQALAAAFPDTFGG
jgi:hypothetical protein